MADATDLGSVEGNLVGVQVPPFAMHIRFMVYGRFSLKGFQTICR